jgi:hypothetical protein
VSWSVVVEVLLLRLEQDRIAYRSGRTTAAPGADLDAVALALAGLEDDAVLHSTSWRREDDRLVVTYAALPDPRPDLPAEPLVAPAVVAGSTPLAPSPEQLHEHHVAAHAVRHLADLAVRDGVVAAAAARHPALWAAVAATAARTPTGTHDETHALAQAAETVQSMPRSRRSLAT